MASNLTYYSAAAEVVPVIFIGLAFESRYFTSRRTYDRPPTDLTGRTSERDPDREGRHVNPFWSMGAIWIAGLLLVGEWAALDVLRDGRPTDLKQGLVGTSLAFGSVFLVLPLIGVQWRHLTEGWRDHLGNLVILVLFFVGLLAAFTWQTVLVLG